MNPHWHTLNAHVVFQNSQKLTSNEMQMYYWGTVLLFLLKRILHKHVKLTTRCSIWTSTSQTNFNNRGQWSLCRNRLWCLPKKMVWQQTTLVVRKIKANKNIQAIRKHGNERREPARKQVLKQVCALCSHSTIRNKHPQAHKQIGKLANIWASEQTIRHQTHRFPSLIGNLLSCQTRRPDYS